MIGEDVIDFYVKLKEDEHMLSPELKKLLNDLRAGESNIRIDREKIQAELETNIGARPLVLNCKRKMNKI